jgi:hypothetical protein
MNTLEECKLTHDGHVDGNAKMPMAPKLSAMEESRSPGECLAHGVRRQDQ